MNTPLLNTPKPQQPEETTANLDNANGQNSRTYGSSSLPTYRNIIPPRRRSYSWCSCFPLRRKIARIKVYCMDHFPLVFFVSLAAFFFVTLLFMCDCYENCTIPDDAPVIVSKQSINLRGYPYVKILMDHGIKGDISVSTSYEWSEDVIIIASMSASNTNMLEYVSHVTTLKQYTSEGESRVFLNMSDIERKKALSKNCTRVNVEVILPRESRYYFNVEINHTFRGNVKARLGDMTNTIRDFTVNTKRGNIKIESLRAYGRVHLEARSGGIEARDLEVSRTTNLIASDSINARVTSQSPELDLTVASSGGYASLVMTRSFLGHFTMTSSHRPKLRARETYLYKTREDNNTIMGYFSYSGREPAYLPFVTVKGVSTALAFNGW